MTDQNKPVEEPVFEIPVEEVTVQDRGQTPVTAPVDESPYQKTVEALTSPVDESTVSGVWDNYHATVNDVLTDDIYTNSCVTQSDMLRAARRMEDQDALCLPMDDKNTTKIIMDTTPRVGVAGSEATRDWGEALTEASSVYLLGSVGDTLLERENADWQQNVANSTGELLRPTRPAINARTGQQLTG
ncbi:MAG: hypothetical protein ACMV0F_01665, partial [Trichlorobacter sp.]